MSLSIKHDFIPPSENKLNLTTATASKDTSVVAKRNTNEIPEPIEVQSKRRLNAEIINSTLQFNAIIVNKPESLLLKTILQGINKALKNIDVEKTVEDSYVQKVDISPEATAQRIVRFSTQFYGVYQQRHPEMNDEESLSTYMEIISGAIDKGFLEAKEILTGLNALEGDTGKNIEKTYVLVQQLLQMFVKNKCKGASSESKEPAEQKTINKGV